MGEELSIFLVKETLKLPSWDKQVCYWCQFDYILVYGRNGHFCRYLLGLINLKNITQYLLCARHCGGGFGHNPGEATVPILFWFICVLGFLAGDKSLFISYLKFLGACIWKEYGNKTHIFPKWESSDKRIETQIIRAVGLLGHLAHAFFSQNPFAFDSPLLESS